MSFLVPAALLVALLVGAPIAAHLLRRGNARELEFPAASLVPAARSTARQRARLEDRGLLALRSLLVLALALLGASPLLRCERLAVARPGGASLALSLVVDDSLSMLATTAGGASRFDEALEAAEQLTDDAREGDAISIVLAGAPARVALSATTDLAAVRRTLGELKSAERSTDLESALRLAKSSLEDLPHRERRVVLLSDLAAPPLSDADLADVIAPLAPLREPFENCGIASAHVRGAGVEVELGCVGGAPNAAPRGLELRASAGSAPLPGSAATKSAAQDEVLARIELGAGAAQTVARLESARLYQGMSVHLTPPAQGAKDALASDDSAPVIPPGQELLIGALADPSKTSVQTGDATVLELALRALATGARVEPLTVLGDEASAYDKFGALLIDDPAGFTPEVRSALERWLREGGIALTFWGPAVATTPLGSTFEPFAAGPLTWQKRPQQIVRPETLAWLGDAASSLRELQAQGRVRLSAATGDDVRVLGSWDDDEAFLIERQVGDGLALSAALPLSVHTSDLALRPGFLALLDHVLDTARARRGGRESQVGDTWEVTGGAEIEGPAGPLPVRAASVGAPGPGGDGSAAPRAAFTAQPDVHGTYVLREGGRASTRHVTLDPAELVRQPLPAPSALRSRTQSARVTQVDVSRELAGVVLLLAVAELALRLWRRRGAVAQRAPD